MGMKLKAKAMCLGCEQKSSDKGVYFIVTLGFTFHYGLD